MQIIQTDLPNETQKQSLLLLQNTCRSHDQISFTFPFDEGCRYYLLYNDDLLLSALCAFFIENNEIECVACTLPQFRQSGYFTQLLDELINDFEDHDLIFPIDDTFLPSLQTMEALEAKFWYQEYLMELPLPAKALSSDQIILSAPSSLETTDPWIFYKDKTLVGSFHLDIQGDKAYFYGFEIVEPLRNKGLGSSCLSLFLNLIESLPQTKKVKKLILQVSSLNAAALSLYKKAGFRITQTLSYYIY